MGTQTSLTKDELALFQVAIDSANYEMIEAKDAAHALDSFVWDMGFKSYAEFRDWMQLRKLPGELSVKRVS